MRDQLLPAREVLVLLWREPTILSIQILVQELALFLNCEHSFFLWSTLVNPNLMSTVILIQPTAISCIINTVFSVPQWNPGPARKNLTNIIAAACGRFHAVILQEASDHVQHISGQFIAHTGNTDLAILLNKDTFEPDPTVLAFRGELHKPKYVGHGATHRSLHFLEHQLLHFADSLWIFSRFRSNFPLHLITSHFLATLSSPHSEHWRHTCTMWVTSAKRLGPRSLQFPSIMGAPGGDDNLTHTLSLRDASTCATRS